MRNEVSYYHEILDFIKKQLHSNFLAYGRDDICIYWGIGELKTNLARIISENPELPDSVSQLSRKIQPLDLDVFGLISDGKKFELIILEMKLLKSVGLKEWSQLIGYCLVADAKYGLLINIDNGCSSRLLDILQFEKQMSKIVNIYNDAEHHHYLGLMQWNSITHNFEYSNLGFIRSLSLLSKNLVADFSPFN